MYYIFLLIFLFILAVFFMMSAILLYHLLKHRLPEKDDSIKPLIVIYITISAVLLLISIVSFSNIPWDTISF